MKKRLLFLAIVFSSVSTFAQWWPTGNAISTGNFLGTTNTQPLLFKTDGVSRMKLNENVNYTINGFNVNNNKDGFLMLGFPPTTGGAFSLLHLNGAVGYIQPLGYRDWMRTGITFTANSDMSYFGLRPVNGLNDVTETTIAWSDNNAGTAGPDDLVFRFMSDNGTVPNDAISQTYATGDDYDGLAVARFTPTGQIGFGNTFGATQEGYVRPKNLLHMSLDNNNPVMLQITNQTGTQETANDGLHIGLPTTSTTNLEARIDQKENDRLTFFTNTSNGGGERMRITHIEAFNNNINFNPGGYADNLTRIGVSLDPTNPITRPLSLFHLGYNVANATTNDGWRSWMNAGMFISQGSDHAYLGMQPSNNGADAVLSWGDDFNGPDNFRIAFTGTNGTPTTIPAGTVNGSEGLRMSPTLTGVFTGIGGDPNNGNPYSGTNGNPGAPLEVNTLVAGQSGLRFTDLSSSTTPQAANANGGVLSVNANGDVIYVQGGGGGGLGGNCGTAQPLTGDYEIALGGNNLYFTSNSATSAGNSIGIGYSCGTSAPYESKLQVSQSAVDGNGFSVGGYFENSSIATYSIGVFGTATNANATSNFGGLFIAQPASSETVSAAVWCYAPIVTPLDGNSFQSSLALLASGNVDIEGGLNVSGVTYVGGVQVLSDSIFKTNLDSVQGALQIVNLLNPVTYNYDTSYNNRFHFGKGLNYGFIAQQVAQVVPSLVSNVVAPPIKDSLGNTIAAALPYKTLNYQGIIPILTKAIQEQQHEIHDKDSVINALRVNDSTLRVNDSILNARLSSLESCINSLGLCNGNGHNKDNGGNGRKSMTTSSTDVELKDGQSIVLDQNVPNPFAEQTTINYFLPEDVSKAQMLFYNAQGKLIQSTELTQRGQGELNVFAQDLSSGIYTYTLVVDGKVFETKKMVRQ